MRMSVVLYVNGVGAKVEVVPEDPKSGFAENQPPPPLQEARMTKMITRKRKTMIRS
jgi:hypothetical protein